MGPMPMVNIVILGIKSLFAGRPGGLDNKSNLFDSKLAIF